MTSWNSGLPTPRYLHNGTDRYHSSSGVGVDSTLSQRQVGWSVIAESLTNFTARLPLMSLRAYVTLMLSFLVLAGVFAFARLGQHMTVTNNGASHSQPPSCLARSWMRSHPSIDRVIRSATIRSEPGVISVTCIPVLRRFKMPSAPGIGSPSPFDQTI